MYQLPAGAPAPSFWSLTFTLYTVSGPSAGQSDFSELRFTDQQEAADTLADFEASARFNCPVTKSLKRRDNLELMPVYRGVQSW